VSRQPAGELHQREEDSSPSLPQLAHLCSRLEEHPQHPRLLPPQTQWGEESSQTSIVFLIIYGVVSELFTKEWIGTIRE
jgi:hypothetical protein